jgi:hypothetical protein
MIIFLGDHTFSNEFSKNTTLKTGNSNPLWGE